VYAVQVLATRPGQAWWWWLDAVLWAVWALFVADYVVRLVLARRRWRFIVRHPLDLIVVAAPFFRFLRLLRLVAAIQTLGRVLAARPVCGTVTAPLVAWFLERVGARDPAEAVTGQRAGAVDPPEPPGTAIGPGSREPAAGASPASSAEVGELFAEIRSLRTR